MFSLQPEKRQQEPQAVRFAFAPYAEAADDGRNARYWQALSAELLARQLDGLPLLGRGIGRISRPLPFIVAE